MFCQNVGEQFMNIFHLRYPQVLFFLGEIGGHMARGADVRPRAAEAQM
jgi:hypothetical protein